MSLTIEKSHYKSHFPNFSLGVYKCGDLEKDVQPAVLETDGMETQEVPHAKASVWIPTQSNIRWEQRNVVFLSSEMFQFKEFNRGFVEKMHPLAVEETVLIRESKTQI